MDAAIGIALVDLEGRPLQCNPALIKMLGYSEKELKSMVFTEFTYPDDAEVDMDLFREMILGKRDYYQIEKRFIHKDGRLVWGRLTVSLVKEPDGKPIYAIGMVEDITEKKRLKDELFEKEDDSKNLEELINIYDNLPIGIVYLDSEFRVLRANKFIYDITGLSKNDLLGKICYETVGEYKDDTSKKGLEKVCSFCKKEECFTKKAPTVIERPLGDRIIKVTTIPELDGEGNIYRFMEIAEDITEQKKAQEELLETGRNLDLLLDSTAEAIYGLDTDGNCTFVNHSCLKLLGYEKEEDILGKNMHNLIHHTKKDGTAYPMNDCNIYRAFRQGKEIHVKDEILWKADGNWFYAEYWSYPIIINREIIGSVVTFLDITDRKNAEIAIQELNATLEERVKERTSDLKTAKDEIEHTNNFLNKIIESIPYPFYVIDTENHKIKLANSAVSRLGDWKKSTCHKISHHSDTPCKSDEHICPLEKMKISKKPEVVEHIHYDPEGKERYFEVHGYPIFDESEELVQMIEFSLDITDRKNAEMITSHLASITENSHDAIASLDLNGAFISWNQGAEEIFGYKKEDVLGKSFGFFVPEEVKNTCFNLLETVSEKGFMRGVKSERVAKDGRRVNVEMTISTLEDIFGEQIGFISILRDISERLKAERELQNLKEFNENIIESSGIGIMVFDGNLNLTAINNAQEKLFEKSREDILGKNVYQFTKLKEESYRGVGFEKILSNVLKGETYRIRGHKHEDVSGGEVFLDFDITPLEIGGEIQGIVFLSEDVTKREEIGKKIINYSKELKKSNDMKDLFSDIMRHDLLNPIGIVGTTAEMVLEDNPEDEDINSIVKNIKKAVDLIDSANLLSKLESSSELEKEEQDLKEVINNLSTDLSPLFKNAGLQFVNNITESMPILAHKMLDHVFINFLTNAVKYAPEGKKVVVDAIDLGDKYRISVTDFGSGIKDDLKEGVFIRFKRKQKEGVKGTGLGLAIVKKLVEMHNGKVWVEDNPKGGSVFVVELPKY